VEVVRASPDDAESLSRVAFAAKRHWGYPERWILQWTDGLTIAPEFVRDNEVYAAADGEKIVGFYALVGEGPKVELEHLWVLPETMGAGVGRALFDHALQTAAVAGAAAVKIEADPHAEGFYKRMGARRVGEEVYELDGQRRALPLLVVELPDRERPD
jgi:ribosomal protein S18 acetylase RimI-like enzyme